MNKKTFISLAVLVALTASVTVAWADTTYTVVGTDGGGAVDASADFSVTANGTITIILKNLETLSSTTKWDDAQLISGLDFTLNTALTSKPSLTSATGPVIADPANGGTQTSESLLVADGGHWGLLSNSTTNVEFSALSGMKPDEQIIGAANDGSVWNVNSSVVQHDPTVVLDATFTISAPGVTTSTNLGALIKSVTFEFGTTPTDIASTGCVGCNVTNVSEASTVDFLGADFGLLALFGGFCYLRRRRVSARA
jgi:hypothetical protein